MFPSQQSEPKEEIENVWSGSEKGKNFKDDDQVMMITVPKHGGKCDVLYLNAASSEEIQMANRASFPVGTSVEEILDRRSPWRGNQWGSVFRDYKPEEIRERELVPFTFDDDDMTISSSDAKGRAPTPPDEMKLPLSPRKRDRKLRRSAKETDAEQGGFLTAMGSEEGKKSSSSSNKRKNTKEPAIGGQCHTHQSAQHGEGSCTMRMKKE